MDFDIDDLTRGDVRSVHVTYESACGRPGTSGCQRHATHYSFDDMGRVIRCAQSNSHGLTTTNERFYSESGHLVELRQSGKNPDGTSWQSRTVYRHDERGRLVEEQHLSESGSALSTKRLSYPDDGTRREFVHFDGSGGSCTISGADDAVGESRVFGCNAARRATLEYLDTGAPRRIIFFGKFGRPVGRVLFESDENGRITHTENYTDAGSFSSSSAASPWLKPFAPLLHWTLKSYIRQWSRWNLLRAGEWRKLSRSMVWGPLWTEIERRYDTQGRKIEERFAMAGKFWSTQSWTYDDSGRLVEQREVDEKGGLQTASEYSYRVDSRGYWISRTIAQRAGSSSAEVSTSVTERTIEYR